MVFDYEESIWGRGTASVKPHDPTSIRLRNALRAIEDLKNGKILEIGCGAGQFIRGIKMLRPELVCFGSDISVEAIKIAEKSGDKVSYLLQEEKKLPFGDEFFDAILIFDVLEHVGDPLSLLKEARRVLKPGGILYAFVPCEGDGLSFWHLLRNFGLGKNLTNKFAGHINYFTRKQIISLGEASGFQTSRLKYSEHFFGQILGIAVFFAMDRAAKRSGNKQINNEAFLNEKKISTPSVWFRRMVNSLVFAESAVLSGVPSPNIHIIFKNPQKNSLP